MHRSLRSLTAVTVVIFLVGAFVLPMGAFAATVKTAKNVTALEEAWYYRYRQPLEPVPRAPGETGDPLPTQQDNVNAQVRSRSNPYEAETLHVGINAGDPEARMFLFWDPFSLSDTGLATIIGGKVTLPLAETRGVRNAENALMLACMNVDPPTSDLGGEWREQPKYDCKTSAPVKLVKNSDPLTWTVNLDVFGAKWKQDPTSYGGISIVEHPEAADSPDSSTWHVAFAGQYNETDNKKVKADLKYEVEELPDLDDFEIPDDFNSDAGAGGFDDSGSFDDGGGFGESNSMAAPGGGISSPPVTGPEATMPDATAEQSGEPALAAPAADEAAPVAAAAQGPITNPFGYWLVPLLGLAVAAVMAWSLTRPVELVNVREGAVSRLMRARAGRA